MKNKKGWTFIAAPFLTVAGTALGGAILAIGLVGLPILKSLFSAPKAQIGGGAFGSIPPVAIGAIIILAILILIRRR